MKKFNKDIELEICSKYLNGITGPPLAREYSCDLHTILNIIRRNGYNVRSQSHKARKYVIDEGFFDHIDSPEKAQILGFLYADGYNNEKYNKVVIALHPQDLDYLERIRQELEFSRELTKYSHTENGKNYPSVRLVISNKHISEQLSKHGCWQKKSLNLQFPNTRIVPKHLIWHFIRGYFEGDGSIYKRKPTNGFYLVIVGTAPFLQNIAKILKRNKINSGMYQHCKSKGCYSLHVSGNRQLLRLLEKLYQSAPFVMKRKYDKYIDLINRCKYLDQSKTPNSNGIMI